MGISIVESVVEELKLSGFQAGVAYPGQKYPSITSPVAAVHIQRVDRAGMLVTMEVNIICPGGMGGTQCELEALRAVEVLRRIGGECIQNGCTYDGIAQVYCVQILATYIAVSDADSSLIGPGFEVFINSIPIRYATAFSAERKSDSQLHFSVGETEPVGSSRGWGGWQFRIEERIPAGIVEQEDNRKVFDLHVDKRSGFREIYYDCMWTSVHRELTREGTLRVRTGIAVSMEEQLIE